MIFRIFLAIICVSASSMVAVAEDCFKALIPDQANVAMSKIAIVAWAEAINQGNYQQVKQDASASGTYNGIPWGANYDEFRANRNNFSRDVKYSGFERDMLAYKTSSISTNAMNVYKDCISRNDQLTVMLVAPPSDQSYKVSVIYRPNENVPSVRGRLRDFTNLENSQVFAKAIAATNFGNAGSASQEFALIPKNRNKEVSLSIAIGTNLSRTLILPPLMTPAPPALQRVVTPLEVCSCVIPGRTTLWGPKGDYCGGQSAYGTYSNNCKSSVEICRCEGGGGLQDISFWGPKNEMCLADVYHSTYSLDCRSIEAADFCSCLAGPGNIAGIELWGPQRNGCGYPKVRWNSYGGRCAARPDRP